MNKLIKKILAVISIILLLIITLIGEAKASLQANPNTHYKKTDTPANWMINIRNMEKSGEAMGLNETLNTDLTSSSESNNIDVHFIRSTEYGAIAILSASGYGNPQTLQQSTIKTTTGNKTGVYFSGGNWEWVAGGFGVIPAGGHSRYYDTYTTGKDSARVGDALGNVTTSNPGCAGWHSASGANWVSGSYPYFVRGGGGLFSFNYYGAGSSGCGRGVAVCGAGL